MSGGIYRSTPIPHSTGLPYKVLSTSQPQMHRANARMTSMGMGRGEGRKQERVNASEIKCCPVTSV